MRVTNRGDRSSAQRAYAAAYAAHYTDRDLGAALKLYRALVGAHPDALEAGYSRAQIGNIVGAVVPQADLLDGQLALAFEHLGGPRVADRTVIPEPTDPERRE